MRLDPESEPCFVISVVSKRVKLHPQTIRYYERQGLLKPSRTGGNVRLYSERDVSHVELIHRLTSKLGVNLAGVEVIIDLREKMERLREEIEAEHLRVVQELEKEVRELRARLQKRKLG
ncbi:MAG: MerR family transcriptional regulator [Armatimonadetes bacterium]|nr:MerR family transcriptional regulator [Armatimonadota bacterium]